MASLNNVEPAYAVHVVSDIDARLKALDAEKKKLTERRKQFAPFLPKKQTTGHRGLKGGE